MAVENKAKQSKFLSNGLQLICDLELGKAIGKNEAIFLQQVYYWLENECCGERLLQKGRKWIYNTYKDWAKQLDWSVSKVRRTIKNLEDLNLLVSCKPRKTDWYHRKSYTINFDSEHIRSVQNEHITKETETTSISSITSGEEVSKKPVKQPPAKLPRKGTISKPEVKESKLTEASQTIYKLVEIYQKQIGEKVTLNKRLGQWLMAAFQKLGSCLKKWENFCKRIATSDWLMGRVTDGFKATLSWLLRFEVMDRVLAGGYKCKEPYEEAPIPTQEDEQQLIQEIEASADTVEEQSVKKTLLKTFGVVLFKSWLNETKIKLEEGKTIILTKSLFYKDYIEELMGPQIRKLYPNALIKMEG